jgi:hypothetical protein
MAEQALKVMIGDASASSLLEVLAGPITSQGKAMGALGEANQLPKKTLYGSALPSVDKANPAGSLAFDAATLPDRYLSESKCSLARSVANTLQGKNPLQITTAPIAAIFSHAHQRYAARSKPLPQDVKAGLGSFFNPEDLNSARYAIYDAEIALPSVILRGGKLFGNQDAVTIGNIIIFRSEPAPFQKNSRGAELWAHELTHVEQYQRFGMHDFVRKYCYSFGSALEKPARARGARAFSEKY